VNVFEAVFVNVAVGGMGVFVAVFVLVLEAVGVLVLVFVYVLVDVCVLVAVGVEVLVLVFVGVDVVAPGQPVAPVHTCLAVAVSRVDASRYSQTRSVPWYRACVLSFLYEVHVLSICA